MVKNLPETQERWVPSLGRKDPLEKEVATHSSILAWRIPWTEESGGLQSMGSQKRQTRLSKYTKAFCSKGSNPTLIYASSLMAFGVLVKP